MGSREKKTPAEEAGAVCPQGAQSHGGRQQVGGCSACRRAEGEGGGEQSWASGTRLGQDLERAREQAWFLHDFFFYCGKIDVTWFPIIIKFIYIVVQPSLPVSRTLASSHADTVTFTH